MIKNLPVSAGYAGLILGQEDPPEEEMAIYSSITAWEIPQTEGMAGYSARGYRADTTEQLSIHASGEVLTASKKKSP